MAGYIAREVIVIQGFGWCFGTIGKDHYLLEAEALDEIYLLLAFDEKAGKKEADMVIMYHLQGFSLKDIARKYNISDARVCQVMSKTKNKLKEMLAA